MTPRIPILLAFAVGFLCVRLLRHIGAPDWIVWFGPALCLIAFSLHMRRRRRARGEGGI